MGWTAGVEELSGLSQRSLAALDQLVPVDVPAGIVLFQPGDAVKGYVVALTGRVGVHLVGATGRELLLYEVTPGSSCVQSTLGLLGGEDYTAEAVAEEPTRMVLIPGERFLALLDDDPAFRRMVFSALAQRMQATMHMLERVAFQSVDGRLAAHLLAHASKDRTVTATQAEIAAAIGSAREVVSRRLEAMRRRGWLEHSKGRVTVTDPAALRRISEAM